MTEVHYTKDHEWVAVDGDVETSARHGQLAEVITDGLGRGVIRAAVTAAISCGADPVTTPLTIT